MIRKQTWVLLVVFAILAAVAFYYQKNPPASQAILTPSPTGPSGMLDGWASSDIARIQYQDSQGSTTLLEQVSQGSWVMQPDETPVDLGKIEEIRTQMVDSQVLTVLDAALNLDAAGLAKPAETVSIWSASGRQAVIRIGGLTPIKSGYYVIVNDQKPVVVSRYAVEGFLDLLKKERLFDYTPTPEVVGTAEAAPKP